MWRNINQVDSCILPRDGRPSESAGLHRYAMAFDPTKLAYARYAIIVLPTSCLSFLLWSILAAGDVCNEAYTRGISSLHSLSCQPLIVECVSTSAKICPADEVLFVLLADTGQIMKAIRLFLSTRLAAADPARVALAARYPTECLNITRSTTHNVLFLDAHPAASPSVV